MANKQIGAKLQELRKKNGLTQKDVYERLGVSQSTFSSWEIGKSEPDAMTFLELCDIYNVNDIISEFTETQRIVETFPLNNIEKEVIIAYRKHPELQPAINKMLDIDSNDAPQKIIRFAARNGKGGEIKLTDEQAKRVQELIASDFPELL